MDYEILDILTLDDDKKYIIADLCTYQKEKYAYLVDYSNHNKILYAKVSDDGNISIVGFSNTKLIDELNKLFSKDVKNVLLNANEMLNNNL